METQKGNNKPEENKIQELQLLEQSLQNTLMQKQAFQMELSETQAALGELKNSGDEVFKIIGQLMIKSEKSKITDDLENKEKILNLRISTLEKQENSLTEKFEDLRKEIINSYIKQDVWSNKFKTFNYLVAKRCNNLIESVQEFIS